MVPMASLTPTNPNASWKSASPELSRIQLVPLMSSISMTAATVDTPSVEQKEGSTKDRIGLMGESQAVDTMASSDPVQNAGTASASHVSRKLSGLAKQASTLDEADAEMDSKQLMPALVRGTSRG